MDWLSFALGVLAVVGVVFIYHVGRAAERIALKRRWQDGEEKR